MRLFGMFLGEIVKDLLEMKFLHNTFTCSWAFTHISIKNNRTYGRIDEKLYRKVWTFMYREKRPLDGIAYSNITPELHKALN